MSQSQFLQTAIHAAKEAEKIILKHYAGDIDVDIKSDQSPVTIADKKAEETIVRILKEAFPEHGFIGEEYGTQNTNAEYQWTIDPIDGTKNFIRKIPLFGSQIALMKDGEIFLGVSTVPALQELMAGEVGNGATINGQPATVSTVDSLNDAFVCFGGLRHFVKHNHIDGAIKLISQAKRDRTIGDCWCYHLLAQGKLDVMVEAAIDVWDIAAAKAIVEAAGGKVTDIHGNPITKESKNIIASNGNIHEQVLACFN